MFVSIFIFTFLVYCFSLKSYFLSGCIETNSSPILISTFLIRCIWRYIINILCNFTPLETVLFDDRHPPWINKEIKKLIHEKKNIFNCFCRSNNENQLLEKLKDLHTKLNFLIETFKGKYYSRTTKKLSGIGKSSKTYWPISKRLLIGKKIPCIPPLLENNEYITDFKEKAELFISFFANQCSLINDNSQLPPTLSYKTNESNPQLKLTMMTYLK